MSFIVAANQPTTLPPGGFERVHEIAAKTYMDADGVQRPFLTTREVESLTIASGSLTVQERQEIESHVTHSFRFLRQIPWTNDLRRIPVVAYAHHEKPNGTGYPSGLHGDDIPLQSKMMMISDIYDALTAADRPYKLAIPPERALGILAAESKLGSLDPELVRIFAEGKVWALTGRQPSQA
jgi:response regulator RpfG family c-di-GMP phosphodiesterase